MRKIISFVLVSSTLAVGACRDGTGNRASAVSGDLSQDLKLASQTQTVRINPEEIAPESHRAVAVRPKRAPTGPQIVRDQHPTRMASATPAVAAPVTPEPAAVVATAPAPAPAATSAPAAGSIPDAPPLARPSPVGAGVDPGPDAGAGAGTVIRGGGTGDDDHCDPHGRRRGGGPSIGIGIGFPIPIGPRGRPLVIRFGSR